MGGEDERWQADRLASGRAGDGLASSTMETTPSGTLPRVSAVILAHDRRDEVALVLDRLRDEPVDEIIVVDSGSSDGTADMVRARPEPHVHLLDPGGNVAIAGRNRGAEAATGELVLMLDDDAFPLPGAVARMRDAFTRDPRLAVAAGRVLDATPEGEVLRSDELGTFDWFFRGGRDLAVGEDGVPVFFFPEGASMVRREAYLAVGGFFEPYFFTVSELDLTTRLVASGWDVRYLRHAEFHHLKAPGGRTSGARTLSYRVRNQIWYFLRHFPAGMAARRIVGYLLFDLIEASYRGALGPFARGIRGAWRDREVALSTRAPLPRSVLRRAELDRARLHVQLLTGQLRAKLRRD